MARTARRERLRALLQAREQSRGLLVAFEGLDGSGKTTQRRLFKTWLESEGHTVVSTEWNSSALIRPLIKARKKLHALGPEDFCLLHAADFRHRLDHVVLPALWHGSTVVADRYLFSGLARDVSRGLDFDRVLRLYEPVLWPDLVFYFNVSPETSSRRVAARRAPSFYDSGQDVTGIADPLASYHTFVTRMMREYENLALVFEFVTVDGERSIYDQHRSIRELFLQAKRRPWAQWNVEAVAEWLRDVPDHSKVAP